MSRTSPAEFRNLPRVVRDALRSAAAEAAITPHEMLSRTSRQHVVAARVKVFWLLRARGYSYPAIGAIFGLHHATVLQAMRRHPKPEPEHEPAAFPDYSGEWAI